MFRCDTILGRDKANFHKPISIKGDFIYAVRPILLDSVGNFSISDRFIGMYNRKRNNNYASSKKKIRRKFKKRLQTTYNRLF